MEQDGAAHDAGLDLDVGNLGRHAHHKGKIEKIPGARQGAARELQIPTVIVMDSDGTKLAQSGYSDCGADRWIDDLEQRMKASGANP